MSTIFFNNLTISSFLKNKEKSARKLLTLFSYKSFTNLFDFSIDNLYLIDYTMSTS